MPPTLRAAIIGTGRIGSTYDDEIVAPRPAAFWQGEHRHNGLYTLLPVNHAGAYTTTPGFTLVAAANRSADKLRAFGQRWGVTALYPDGHQLLRSEVPDVVSICTQSPEKAELTMAAAATSGVKAIIVEKAMATSLAEADAMLAACQRHNVLLVVNHPNRFSPVNRRARALIDDGALGPLATVSAYSTGGMLHVGTHTFDLLRYLAGPVTEIAARVPNYAPARDLPAAGQLWFASGATGFFDHTHGLTPSYEARGPQGFLTLSSLVGDGFHGTIAPFYPAGTTRHYPSRLTVAPLLTEPPTLSPTQRLLTELYASLTTGAPFLSTGHDGAAALELGLACYAAHLAGQPVRLPLTDRTLRVPNR